MYVYTCMTVGEHCKPSIYRQGMVLEKCQKYIILMISKNWLLIIVVYASIYKYTNC